ncbi:hypothetical protein CSUI_004418 [Cystoisospora suis]|uniref:Transmembrane protein n=1 Tax=Cystoisospora suis TaxID=483139 RepID=A0A2C6L107_9APIC|nr:hypothetical protein CSUI_004418 [Cystoisospora suis]
MQRLRRPAVYVHPYTGASRGEEAVFYEDSLFVMRARLKFLVMKRVVFFFFQAWMCWYMSSLSFFFLLSGIGVCKTQGRVTACVE